MNKFKKIYNIELDSPEHIEIIAGTIFNLENSLLLATPEQLHGEYWCLSKTNTSTRLFRDKIGIIPCYYYFKLNKLIVSSHLQGLIDYLDSQGITLTYNEKYAAEINSENFRNQTNTIINEINRCSPATEVIFSKQDNAWKSLTRRYWAPQLDKKKYNKNLYSHSLYSVIQNCIQDRTLSSNKIALFLSGGLDSTILYYFLNSNNNTMWRSYAVEFSSGTKAYEKNLRYHNKNIEKILWDSSIKSECLATNKSWPFSTLYSPGLGLFLPLYKRAKCDGMNVVWTGLGGDDYFSSPELFKSKNIFLKFIFFIKNQLKGLEGTLFQKLLRNRVECSGNYSFGIECEQQVAIEHNQIMSYPLMDDRLYNWILLYYSPDFVNDKELLRQSVSSCLPYDIAMCRSKQDLQDIHRDLITASYGSNKQKDFPYSNAPAILNPYLKKMKEHFREKSEQTKI